MLSSSVAGALTDAGSSFRELAFTACGRTFSVQFEDDETRALLMAGFGGLLAPIPATSVAATGFCRIERGAFGRGFRVVDGGGGAARLDDVDGLLFYLDKRLAIELQHLRPDLYFLHAAAVARDGRVALLIAPSGTGKSTLALALLNNGFEYLSDELAPVDVHSLTVHPYAHALCLKSAPPTPYCLPAGTLAAGDRFHVPTEALRCAFHTKPLPLAAAIFVRRAVRSTVICRSMSAASAAIHFVANALNSAAHAWDGLDAAVTLSRAVPCIALESTDLEQACSAIGAVLSRRTGSESES